MPYVSGGRTWATLEDRRLIWRELEECQPRTKAAAAKYVELAERLGVSRDWVSTQWLTMLRGDFDLSRGEWRFIKGADNAPPPPTCKRSMSAHTLTQELVLYENDIDLPTRAPVHVALSDEQPAWAKRLEERVELALFKLADIQTQLNRLEEAWR